MMVEGQIEGGVVQAQGYALLEDFQVKGGRVITDQLSTYLIPTVLDVPESIDSLIVEVPDPRGLRVDAIDYASGAVRIAQEQTAGRLADSLEVHYADGVRLPFPDGSYHDGKLGEIYRPRPETQPCYTDLRAIYAQLYPALKGIHRQASAFRVQYGG